MRSVVTRYAHIAHIESTPAPKKNNYRILNFMDLSFILKIAGIGMIVAVTCQILNKIGRDEQATMVSVAGIIVVLIMLIGQLGDLYESVKDVFGL